MPAPHFPHLAQDLHHEYIHAADPATVRGGTSVIAEADRIVGSFATILKPTNGWKVDYETATVEGEEVVTRITLTVPSDGTVIVVK